jgi:hypothetical protein
MSPNTICNCKICRSNLADIINSKFENDNISLSDGKKFLSQNHVEVTENVIKRHLKAYKIEISSINTKNTTITPSEIILSATSSVINRNGEILIDLNDINLDKYDFDKNCLGAIATYIQKIHLGLYLKQAEITYQELSEYQNGLRENYPNAAINNLKKLFELLEKSSGIRYSIDINAAVDKIHREGYKIISDGEN